MPAVVPSSNRGGAEAAREGSASARLALAELLLISDDPAECARSTVDWLAERGGARKSICALIDAESGTLQHVAASGVSDGQLEALPRAFGEPGRPLVFALAGREAVTLGRNGNRGNGAHPDPWRGDFVAMPLPIS